MGPPWKDLVWNGTDLHQFGLVDLRGLGPSALVAHPLFDRASAYIVCYDASDKRSLEKAEMLVKVPEGG